MSHVFRQPRILLALLCSVAAICLGMIGPKGAEASWSGYCTVTLNNRYDYCNGSLRDLHQVYGWGDQHSVCVSIVPYSWTERCSSGPGAGVYSPTVTYMQYVPRISNNAAGSNLVHGISFTP